MELFIGMINRSIRMYLSSRALHFRSLACYGLDCIICDYIREVLLQIKQQQLSLA